MPLLHIRIAVTDSLLADEVRGKLTGSHYQLKAEVCHKLAEQLFSSPHLKTQIVHEHHNYSDQKYMECTLVVGEEHHITMAPYETSPYFR